MPALEAAIIASAGLKLAGGIFGSSAAKQQAEIARQQGRLSFEESLEQAEITKAGVRQFEQRQGLAFLKSGVTLEGSPLLTLLKTRQEGAKQVAAIKRRGAAALRFGIAQAGGFESQSRAALIGGIAGATSTAIQGFK